MENYNTETKEEKSQVTICWQDIIDSGKILVIPYYQRGYIWGKKSDKRSKDAVTYMLDSIEEKQGKDLFIQGITVYENESEIYLIDGQQRTTFFYILLRILGNKSLHLRYLGLRENGYNDTENISPAEWLNLFNADTPCEDNPYEYYQDIWFFKNTARAIHARKEQLNIEYVLKQVRFLKISINKEQQLVAFRMMNGNKAEMRPHEKVKADLLRHASSGDGGYSDKLAQEWDNDMLRRNYALAWDRWLYWWNRRDVINMYRLAKSECNSLGRLLPHEFMKDKQDSNVYEGWRREIQADSQAMAAKRIFNRLRKLQLAFEEAFDRWETYNAIGTVLCLLHKDNKAQERFLREYFSDKRPIVLQDLEQVNNLLLFGVTLEEILEGKYITDEKVKEKLTDTVQILTSKPVYALDERTKEAAFRYLLVRNVEKDSGRKRKFDFSIWNGNRSLEHVMPKSRVFHKDNATGEWLDCNENVVNPENLSNQLLIREEIVSAQEKFRVDGNDNVDKIFHEATINEHSIGNLLLLYSDENSGFGNKTPNEKRLTYFDVSSLIFKSRNLLHTMYSFCRFKNDFGANEICENQLEAIQDILNRYNKIFPE